MSRLLCRWSPSPTSGTPAAVYETEAERLDWQLHVPEPRKGDVGISLQMRCQGVNLSTPVSSAAFSGSRRARLRAQRVRRAQPESSKTRPRPLSSVCTVLCLRWSLQRMEAPLLWGSQVKYRWVSLWQMMPNKIVQNNRRDESYQERYRWRKPPGAH